VLATEYTRNLVPEQVAVDAQMNEGVGPVFLWRMPDVPVVDVKFTQKSQT